jgi:hypothetical protein
MLCDSIAAISSADLAMVMYTLGPPRVERKEWYCRL